MEAVTGPESALRLADEAFARFEVEGVVAHLSAAVRGFTSAGDPRAAAMACVRLGDVLANGRGNLTAGRAWFARAARLVADLEPCIEQGWVAVAALGCDAGDPEELLRRAEIALDRARRFGDLNLEAKALADGGLAHVQAGRVDEGFAMLDEAMALACGPVDDGETAAKSACSFFTACYYTASFDRAGDWAAMLRERGVLGAAPGGQIFTSNHCASLEGALLCELGRWQEAEALLTAASEQFEATMGSPAFHSAIVLADLRIRQGRLAEAEALLATRAQSYEGHLPAARLHLARMEHDLAAACARRGLRTLGDDRARAIELLAVLVDAKLASGDLGGARAALDDLSHRAVDVDDVPSIAARGATVRARLLAAEGDRTGAVAALESALDRVDASRAPWRRALLLVELARCRAAAGDANAARADAHAAAVALGGLDVVLAEADACLLRELAGEASPPTGQAAPPATLARTGKTWRAGHAGSGVQLRDSKGIRYLAELLAAPGTERHVLDLVDGVEGVDQDAAVDRRRLGDAGPVADTAARTAYRRRVEELRADIDDALAGGALEQAEELQGELDALVGELARAFGLGGRSRTVADAAERARLNVTRALRTAVTRIEEVLPEAGGALDRALRTGRYCAYAPSSNEIRWIVQREVNGMGPS